MYEVEYKVEITKPKRDTMVSLFEARNFVGAAPRLQNDFYIEAKDSPFGGRDLKRYRDEGEKIFYTEKIWEKNGEGMARKETEREASREEFTSEIKKYPNAITIKKERQSFSVMYQDREIHIDMDTVKFGQSTENRYFIEAEIICENKADVEASRNFVINFLKDIFEKSEIVEAPGMFDLALSHSK